MNPAENVARHLIPVDFVEVFMPAAFIQRQLDVLDADSGSGAVLSEVKTFLASHGIHQH